MDFTSVTMSKYFHPDSTILTLEGLFRSDSESIHKFQTFNDIRPTYIRIAECSHNKL